MENVYVFLVDKPFAATISPDERFRDSKLSLWVPYGTNRAELPIPQIYADSDFSAFESLTRFFKSEWHLQILTRVPISIPLRNGRLPAIDPLVFAYTWAACTWKINLNFIEADIEAIAFKSIKRPNLAVNDRLLDRRHDLFTLRYKAKSTVEMMPGAVETFYSSSLLPEPEGVVHPKKMLEQVLQDSRSIESFWKDTFDMLMSSVSVWAGLVLLTQLAAIYLPISLMTGIFGMNVAGLNGVPAWSCVVTLLAIVIITGVLIFVMRLFPTLDPGLSMGEIQSLVAPDRGKPAGERAASHVWSQVQVGSALRNRPSSAKQWLHTQPQSQDHELGEAAASSEV